MHTTRPVYTITNKKHEPCAAVTPLSSDDMVAANDNRSSLRQNAARVVHVRRTARQRRGNRGNTYSVCAPYPLWCWPATQGAPFGGALVQSGPPAAAPPRPEKRKVTRTVGQKRTVWDPKNARWRLLHCAFRTVRWKNARHSCVSYRAFYNSWPSATYGHNREAWDAVAERTRKG